MAETDQEYYRAANKGQFLDGVWKRQGEELADGLLHGDIERRYWTVTVHRKGGKKVEEPRSRQDWSITGGKIDTGAGTSLHSVIGKLGYRSWHYLEIPMGSMIPASLIIMQRGEDPEHYQIEIRDGIDMTPDALRGALDSFARNIVVRLKQIADGSGA